MRSPCQCVHSSIYNRSPQFFPAVRFTIIHPSDANKVASINLVISGASDHQSGQSTLTTVTDTSSPSHVFGETLASSEAPFPPRRLNDGNRPQGQAIVTLAEGRRVAFVATRRTAATSQRIDSPPLKCVVSQVVPFIP